MPLIIEEISVRNLGPLKELHLHLSKFNLLYGRNEYGKTLLVEFILRSMFSKSKSWMLRNSSAVGKVCVAGLRDEPIVFSPNSSINIFMAILLDNF